MEKTEQEKNAMFAEMALEMGHLRSQLMIMQKKCTELEKRINQTEQDEKIEYYTDKEEFAKETEWIRVKQRNVKKRRMYTSLTPPSREQNVSTEEERKPKKVPAPPPVIVDNIANFNEIHEKLSKMMTRFQIKIMKR